MRWARHALASLSPRRREAQYGFGELIPNFVIFVSFVVHQSPPNFAPFASWRGNLRSAIAVNRAAPAHRKPISPSLLFIGEHLREDPARVPFGDVETLLIAEKRPTVRTQSVLDSLYSRVVFLRSRQWRAATNERRYYHSRRRGFHGWHDYLPEVFHRAPTPSGPVHFSTPLRGTVFPCVNRWDRLEYGNSESRRLQERPDSRSQAPYHRAGSGQPATGCNITARNPYRYDELTTGTMNRWIRP